MARYENPIDFSHCLSLLHKWILSHEPTRTMQSLKKQIKYVNTQHLSIFLSFLFFSSFSFGKMNFFRPPQAFTHTHATRFCLPLSCRLCWLHLALPLSLLHLMQSLEMNYDALRKGQVVQRIRNARQVWSQITWRCLIYNLLKHTLIRCRGILLVSDRATVHNNNKADIKYLWIYVFVWIKSIGHLYTN